MNVKMNGAQYLLRKTLLDFKLVAQTLNYLAATVVHRSLVLQLN